jgi:hypothetical protein
MAKTKSGKKQRVAATKDAVQPALREFTLVERDGVFGVSSDGNDFFSLAELIRANQGRKVRIELNLDTARGADTSDAVRVRNQRIRSYLDAANLLLSTVSCEESVTIPNNVPPPPPPPAAPATKRGRKK